MNKFLMSVAMSALFLAACAPSSKKEQALVKETTEQQEENVVDTIEDFTLPDTEGNKVSAYSVIRANKLTIVDFWASWCPPCVAEMPNVKNLYDTFNKKGLGIISVSLDKEKDAWTNAIKKFGMTWTNVSDLKGWENAAAVQYGVRSIPFMIVVNEKGEPVASGVVGDDLKKIVENYLNKQ